MIAAIFTRSIFIKGALLVSGAWARLSISLRSAATEQVLGMQGAWLRDLQRAQMRVGVIG
jgi:hypothetical protein